MRQLCVLHRQVRKEGVPPIAPTASFGSQGLQDFSNSPTRTRVTEPLSILRPTATREWQDQEGVEDQATHLFKYIYFLFNI